MDMSIRMQKISLYFPKKLLTDLKDISEKTGAPVSEVIRRAVKSYLEKENKKENV
jgi:metal-responsive CopG/Arc/MetJ family transcriptional regulator